MKTITSKENQVIKQAFKLKTKKEREKNNEFFIEGKNLVKEALRKPNLTKKVFIIPDLISDFEEEITRQDSIEWYEVEQKLLDYICTTETPQGIGAIVEKPKWSFDDLVEGENILLLLDQISDPGNLGSIIRTAWAMNIDGVLLTKGSVDSFSPKVVRATMGGVFNIPIINDVTIEQIDILKNIGYTIACTDLNTSQDIYNTDFSKKLVIVMGSEARGVNTIIKEKSDEFFKIPIDNIVDSLNVSIACGIILGEVFRQRRNNLESGHSLF